MGTIQLSWTVPFPYCGGPVKVLAAVHDKNYGRRLRAVFDQKLAAYPNSHGATLVRRAFLRKRPDGIGPRSDDVRYHDLAELYALA